MKYIIFDNVNGVFDFPIIFPEVVSHSTIGEKFGGKNNIISAGYVGSTKPSTDYPDKPPRPEDVEAISRMIDSY